MVEAVLESRWWTDTAKLTNMIISRFGDRWDLVRKSEVFIEYEAEVSSRVIGVEWGVVDYGKLFTETSEQKFSLRGVKCVRTDTYSVRHCCMQLTCSLVYSLWRVSSVKVKFICSWCWSLALCVPTWHRRISSCLAVSGCCWCWPAMDYRLPVLFTAVKSVSTFM